MPPPAAYRDRNQLDVDASSPWLGPGYWSREALIGTAYDVASNGKRFLVVTRLKDIGGTSDIVVIQHWDQELKALVPSR